MTVTIISTPGASECWVRNYTHVKEIKRTRIIFEGGYEIHVGLSSIKIIDSLTDEAPTKDYYIRKMGIEKFMRFKTWLQNRGIATCY